LRVGIHCLCTHPAYKGGVNSVTFGLLDAFARVGAPHEFKVFVTPWNRQLFERYESVPNFDLVEVSGLDHRWLRAIQRRLPAPLEARVPLDPPSVVLNARQAEAVQREADVLYVPYVPPPDILPLPDVPTVYSLHDIQHVHYPEFFTREELLEREVRFERTVEHAAAVQANCRYMARDFRAHFPKLNESNVEVIPTGVDLSLFSAPLPELDVIARHRLPGSFLFTPAQLWPHKNHLTVLKALKRLKERGLVLPWVLTGEKYRAADAIFDFVRDNELDEQVFYLGVVPLDDLIGLYQSARFLVTASLHESSSLPILEAAAAGTPVIAARIPPHEEMAEQLEMRLFAPTDDAELADVLAEAWTADEETNAAQAAANRASVQHYSWDNAARLYIRLFERVHREAGAVL